MTFSTVAEACPVVLPVFPELPVLPVLPELPVLPVFTIYLLEAKPCSPLPVLTEYQPLEACPRISTLEPLFTFPTTLPEVDGSLRR